jgi:CubicO group peptidase (beta-lactamase class C family)
MLTIPLVAQTALQEHSTLLPSDVEIRDLLVDRIDVQHKSIGMVVGIITPQGRRIISHGRANEGDSRPLDGDTVFEIGSVTKIFTALLLADMSQRREVGLSDPVAKYLPKAVSLPERNGRAITLVDLATQTSGLPFFPSNFPIDDRPAFSKYTIEQLYKFLSGYSLQRDPGSQWEYSNTGFGLLGQALASKAGLSYQALVQKRITTPLGMKSTAIDVSPKMSARLAAGHDAKLEPTLIWTAPAFEGAGSLRSTANDLLTFLAAFMNYRKSPLSPAMDSMLETQRPGPGFSQALGWWIIKIGTGDGGFMTHEGGTFGYSSTVAYDPKTQVGVVVLSNAVENDGGLAWHLLRPQYPVATSAAAKSVQSRDEIVLDSKLLDKYAGKYQPPQPGEAISIERLGDRLYLKSTSAPQGLQLHAESEKKFFIMETDLQITFQVDNQGRTTGLIVHFAGIDTLAPRLDSGPREN